MKKIFKYGLLLVLSTLLVFALVGCGGSGSTDQSSGEGDGVTYSIATDTTLPPFEFENDEGKRAGIDIDLLDAIAKNQGFKYELQPLGFNAAVSALEADQVDGVMAGMSITEDRKQKFDFSEPYFDSGVVCAVTENSTITDYEGLRGKNVAVKDGTEGARFAESIKDTYGFTINPFQNSANMYEDVKDGNSAACFEDYPVIGYAINQGQPLKIIGDVQQANSYGFAVNKNSEEGAKLLQMFNAGLTEVRESGEYDEIVNTYITK